MTRNQHFDGSRSVARCAAVLALQVLFTLDTDAATVIQSQAFRIDGANVSQGLAFTPFDPGLGMLESVDVTYTATLRQQGALWNSTDVPAAILYTSSLTAVKLSINTQEMAFADLGHGPVTTGVLAAVSLGTFATEFAAGAAQHAAGMAPVFPSAFQWLFATTIAGGSGAPFDGDIEVALIPGTWTVIAPNAFAVSLLEITGEVTATFQYRPAVVPDTLPLAGPAAILGVMILVAGNRRLRR